MASRVLGFGREVLIAAILGTGPIADAFVAAFRFPNLFRRLFGEATLNPAFVPVFARELEKNGKNEARAFAQNVFSWLIFILLVLTALAEIFMPFLVSTVIAPAFAEQADKFALTVEFTRIMFPYLICMSLVALLSGVLNGLRQYFLAAFAPVALNIILIAVLVFALYSGADAQLSGRLLSWGVLVAGLVQLALLYVGAKRQGFTLIPRWPRPSKKARKLLVLALPVVLTGGITQINLLVGQIIASAQDGAIAMLNYADRIYQLPLGMVGIAIAVVLLPELSRALGAGDKQEATRLQSRSLEFALLLTLPAAVGIYLLAEPIINVVYERGEFQSEDTRMTALALSAFAIGLPSFVLQKVLQPAYFARYQMRAPMWFALISAVVNIVFSLALFPYYGHVGIAVATSIAGWTGAGLLWAGLKMNRTFELDGSSLTTIAKIMLGALVMGAATYWLQPWFIEPFVQAGFFLRALALLGLVGVSATLYFGSLFALGAFTLSQLKRNLRRTG